ncbi:unnamed protein product [Caretta caretta]
MLHLQVASPTLALLSLLLLLVALGSDHWLLLKENQVVMHSGLWKLCMNLGCLIPLNVPGLCATVAMAMFTSQSTKTIMITSPQVSFGWSFYVGWAACPLSLLANYIEATKMFLMLGLLAGLLSAFSLLALLRGSSFDTVSPFVVSAMGSFSAGFCILIALTVFTSEFAEVMKVTWLHVSFGWSWGLGWASIPLFLLTGGVTLLAQESNSI